MKPKQYEPIDAMDRRTFLARSAGVVTGAALLGTGLIRPALAKPATVLAQDLRDYDFLMPRVAFGCDRRVKAMWSVYPGADRNLLYEFSQVVRCKVKLPKDCNDTHPINGTEEHFNAVVDFSDPDALRKFPFLFMTAEGEYRFSKEKKENLKQYISEGGFLLMDDCVFKKGGDFFYKSSVQLLREVFGPQAVRQVSLDHEVFHNVFDLGQIGLPFFHGQKYGPQGVFVGDRLAIFLSSTDIHCGWAACRGKQKPIYKECIQMGINLIMYALSH